MVSVSIIVKAFLARRRAAREVFKLDETAKHTLQHEQLGISARVFQSQALRADRCRIPKNSDQK